MNLIYLGDETLRQKAEPVVNIDDELNRLLDGMSDILRRNNGIGLAAPQVGIRKRFFIVKIAEGNIRVFINLQILATSNELSTHEEGCLSIPGIYSEVVRPESVEVQAFNEKGKPFTLNAKGLLARVIQHEYDHLEGILFIDRLDEKKRWRLEQEFAKTHGRIGY
jgi:peptide deformylase